MKTPRSMKVGKIAIISLITVLIWVWADRALEESYDLVGLTVKSAQSMDDPNLQVSFGGGDPTAEIKSLKLTGPGSKIRAAKRQLESGEQSKTFYLDPNQHGLGSPGRHSVSVKDLLEQVDWIAEMGLSVSECRPPRLDVNIEKLVIKEVPVVCLDSHRMPIDSATVTPSHVMVSVPEGWVGSAAVVLSQKEQDNEVGSVIRKIPFVQIAPGKTKQARSDVEITVPPGLSTLKSYTITTGTLGVTLSSNIQGRYKVEVFNVDEVVSAIRIIATADAKAAYENLPYQVVLEIDDSDPDSTEPLRREVSYNFPDEYIDKGQIRLDQQPVMARFELTPISPGAEPAVGGTAQ